MNLYLGPAFTRAQAGTRARLVIFGLLVGIGCSDGDRARPREGWPAGNTDVPASRKVADAIRHMSGSSRTARKANDPPARVLGLPARNVLGRTVGDGRGYASELPAGPVPAYATSNLRFAWQPMPRIELAIVGQNLHDARHTEWPSSGSTSTQLRRRAFITMTWRH